MARFTHFHVERSTTNPDMLLLAVRDHADEPDEDGEVYFVTREDVAELLAALQEVE